MKFPKLVRTMTVKHRNGDTDTVPEGKKADVAYMQFEDEQTVDTGDKLVPFHAVDSVETAREAEDAFKPDAPCEVDCEFMGEPDIIGAGKTLNVMAGEEFDPLDGVVAYDDNGKTVTVTVEVEGE